jgi:aminopeptidase N
MHMQKAALLLLGFGIGIQATYGQFFLPDAPGDEEALMKSEARRYTALMKTMHMPASEPNIDVTYYKLNISLTTSPQYLRGIVSIRALSTVGSLTSITLDLMSSMTVDSVKTETARLSFSRQPTTVTVMLERGYGMGDPVHVDIYYRGVPGSSGFGSFTFSTHAGAPWVYTLSEPHGAKDWWPCKDHPLDKADSVDIWVTVDSTLKVGSNGKLLAVINNGDGTKTYQWAERYPISTYLVSMAVSNYAEFTNWFKYSQTDSMPVLNYVLPEHLSSALTNLPRTIDMLHVYSSAFGLYPFVNEKYGHVEFGWSGGMEHQTMTSLNGFSENLVAHELAHQWFGDMITCANWPNIWLNEGFATYCVAVYRGVQYGESAYTSYMNSQMSSARNAVGPLYVLDTTNVNTLFNNALVYAKGATVLHMLRHVLGDSVFLRSLKAYAQESTLRFGVATTEDFQQVCERVSGTALGTFFSQWIYGRNYPRYSYSWRAIPDTDGGFIVPIRIQQTTGTTTPAYFTMPVDFKLTGDGLDTTVVLLNDLTDQEFRVHVSRLPTAGVLDPNNWILKTATAVSVEEEESQNAPVSLRLEQNYPNPFNGSTTIRYALPHHGIVNLSVYNTLGEMVAELVKEDRPGGEYQVTFNAASLPSGVYFYRLQVGAFVETRRLLMIR